MKENFENPRKRKEEEPLEEEGEREQGKKCVRLHAALRCRTYVLQLKSKSTRKAKPNHTNNTRTQNYTIYTQHIYAPQVNGSEIE